MKKQQSIKERSTITKNSRKYKRKAQNNKRTVKSAKDRSKQKKNKEHTRKSKINMNEQQRIYKKGHTLQQKRLGQEYR